MKLDEEQQIQLVDLSTSEIIGVIPKFFMYDSSDEQRYSESIDLSLERSEDIEGQYKVTLTVDSNFLYSESTQYPVIIDPTATYGTESTWADTFVQSAYPNTNYYLRNQLRTGYDSSTGKVRSYIKYKTLPELGNVSILSAQYYAYNTTGTISTSYATVNLHRVTSDWNVSAITWNNAATFSSSVESSKVVTVDGWYSWDFTQLCKDWYSGVQNYYGFVLKEKNETIYYRRFHSSDSSTVPYMQIQYANLPTNPTGLTVQSFSSGTNTEKGYVNLTWNAASHVTGYKIAIYNGKYYEYFDVGNVTSWTSLGKKIWPTVTEVKNGRYVLHHDGLGDDLPNSPKQTYINSGGYYQTNNNYWFRVIAYNSYGQSDLLANGRQPILPDSTSPSKATNIILTVSNNPSINTANSWEATVAWDEAIDLPVDIASGIQSYKIRLYKEGVSEVQRIAEVTNKPHSVKFTGLSDSTKYYATVQVYDLKGNYSVESKSNNISTGDRTPPSKPSTVSLDKSSWNNSNSILIYWAGITDNQSIKSIQYAIDGGPWTSTEKNTGSGSFALNTSGFSEGEHIISIRAIDDENNYGESLNVSYFRDTTKPQVAISNLNQLQDISGSVDVFGAIYDVNIKKWTLEYGLGENPTSYNEIAAGISNLSNSKLTTWQVDGLDSGIYTLRLRASDAANNEIVTIFKVNILSENDTSNTTIRTSKKEFNVVIAGSKISNINGRYVEVFYNSQHLEVVDLSAITFKNELSPGEIEGTSINIILFEPGYIKFTVNESIAEGRLWSGVLNAIKFRSIIEGEVEVTYTISQ